eukprot:UN11173
MKSQFCQRKKSNLLKKFLKNFHPKEIPSPKFCKQANYD